MDEIVEDKKNIKADIKRLTKEFLDNGGKISQHEITERAWVNKPGNEQNTLDRNKRRERAVKMFHEGVPKIDIANEFKLALVTINMYIRDHKAEMEKMERNS